MPRGLHSRASRRCDDHVESFIIRRWKGFKLGPKRTICLQGCGVFPGRILLKQEQDNSCASPLSSCKSRLEGSEDIELRHVASSFVNNTPQTPTLFICALLSAIDGSGWMSRFCGRRKPSTTISMKARRQASFTMRPAKRSERTAREEREDGGDRGNRGGLEKEE